MTILRVSMLKKIVAYTWVAIAIAALYLGYTFYSRYDANQKQAIRTAEHEAEEAHDELDRLGGTTLKITQLYAPAVLAKGETGKLCYGVVNAKTIALDPPVDRVWPALTRCIEIKPKQTTNYTLTATDAAGHSVQQSALVQVR
jgi:hypothetical protein